MITRLAKIVIAASLAVFAGLVTYTNIVDYGSNYEFVKHVLSMDTTFKGEHVMGRAITDPALWTAAYWLIIGTEACVALLFAWGAWSMWRARNGTGAHFETAKRPFIAGAILAFLLWFFGFLVIGGEWFLMWQSPQWNGQQAAFRIAIIVLAALIYINQPERELEP